MSAFGHGRGFLFHLHGEMADMAFLLWLLAVAIVIVGIVQLFQGQIILGIVLIIAGCLVGPGGYSIFHRRSVA
jgi:hypothetical protein